MILFFRHIKKEKGINIKRYIAVHCGCGYCGCDLDDVLILDSDISDENIAEIAWEMAFDNAESNIYTHFGGDREYDEEAYEDYIENNVVVDWRDITYNEYLNYCKENGYMPLKES